LILMLIKIKFTELIKVILYKINDACDKNTESRKQNIQKIIAQLVYKVVSIIYYKHLK